MPGHNLTDVEIVAERSNDDVRLRREHELLTERRRLSVKRVRHRPSARSPNDLVRVAVATEGV
jgi:hypothetical protein